MTRNARVSLTAKLLALVTALFAMIAMAVPASTAVADDTSDTTLNNVKPTFEKYLVMDENANIPNATFEFTLKASSEGAIINGDKISAGLMPLDTESLTANVTFNPNDITYSSVQDGDTVKLENGQKYAKATVTFTGLATLEFAPGIYRYTVTETTPTHAGIVNRDKELTLDIYVQYAQMGGDVDYGTLTASYVLTLSGDTKVAGFTNVYTTHDLTLEKKVTGNQGDRSKKFTFTVVISGGTADDQYTVSVPNGSSTNNGKNPSTLKLSNSSGTVQVTGTYELAHDEAITIYGLPPGMKYTITETSYSDDGYTTTNDVNNGGEADGKTTNEQTMGDNNVTVTFTNNKDGGTVPTGLLLEVAPYVLLVVVIACGLVALTLTSRKQRNR